MFRDQNEVARQMADLKFGEEMEMDKEVCTGNGFTGQLCYLCFVCLFQNMFISLIPNTSFKAKLQNWFISFE